MLTRRSHVWTTPGVLGDIVPGKTSTVTATQSVAAGQALTATLDAGLVQEWVVGSNNGIVLSQPSGAQYASCQPSVEPKPQLTVTYTCPSGFVVSADGTACNGGHFFYCALLSTEP
jgi:hypothetical protein